MRTKYGQTWTELSPEEKAEILAAESQEKEQSKPEKLRALDNEEFELRDHRVARGPDGELVSSAPDGGDKPGKSLDKHIEGLRDSRDKQAALHDFALERAELQGFKYNGKHLDEAERIDIQLQFQEADRHYQRADRNAFLAPTGSLQREQHSQAAIEFDSERMRAQVRLVEFDRDVKCRFEQTANQREQHYQEGLQRRELESNQLAERRLADQKAQLSAEPEHEQPSALEVWAQKHGYVPKADQKHDQSERDATTRNQEQKPSSQTPQSAPTFERATERAPARAPEPHEIDGYSHKSARDHIAYAKSADNTPAFRDYGKRLAIDNSQDADNRRAVLTLASERFQGNFGCNGTEDYKRSMAQTAHEMGLSDRFSSPEMKGYVKEYEAKLQQQEPDRETARAPERDPASHQESVQARDQQPEHQAAPDPAQLYAAPQVDARNPEPKPEPDIPVEIDRNLDPVDQEQGDVSKRESTWGYDPEPVNQEPVPEPTQESTQQISHGHEHVWGYSEEPMGQSPEPRKPISQPEMPSDVSVEQVVEAEQAQAPESELVSEPAVVSSPSVNQEEDRWAAFADSIESSNTAYADAPDYQQEQDFDRGPDR